MMRRFLPLPLNAKAALNFDPFPLSSPPELSTSSIRYRKTIKRPVLPFIGDLDKARPKQCDSRPMLPAWIQDVPLRSTKS
jgi:hypothetical protein